MHQFPQLAELAEKRFELQLKKLQIQENENNEIVDNSDDAESEESESSGICIYQSIFLLTHFGSNSLIYSNFKIESEFDEKEPRKPMEPDPEDC